MLYFFVSFLLLLTVVARQSISSTTFTIITYVLACTTRTRTHIGVGIGTIIGTIISIIGTIIGTIVSINTCQG